MTKETWLKNIKSVPKHNRGAVLLDIGQATLPAIAGYATKRLTDKNVVPAARLQATQYYNPTVTNYGADLLRADNRLMGQLRLATPKTANAAINTAQALAIQDKVNEQHSTTGAQLAANYAQNLAQQTNIMNQQARERTGIANQNIINAVEAEKQETLARQQADAAAISGYLQTASNLMTTTGKYRDQYEQAALDENNRAVLNNIELKTAELNNLFNSQLSATPEQNKVIEEQIRIKRGEILAEKAKLKHYDPRVRFKSGQANETGSEEQPNTGQQINIGLTDLTTRPWATGRTAFNQRPVYNLNTIFNNADSVDNNNQQTIYDMNALRDYLTNLLQPKYKTGGSIAAKNKASIADYKAKLKWMSIKLC